MTKKVVKQSDFRPSSNEFYKPFFIFFLILNLARIAASIFPDTFLFGLDFYKSFPLGFSVVFIFFSLLFLSRSINESVGQFLRSLTSFFYREDGTIKWIALILFLGICTVGFYILRVKPYLGDGVSRVQDLDKEYLNTIKDFLVYRSFQSLSLLLYYKTGDIFYRFGIERFKVFYFYNCISGIVFLYFVFRLSSEVFETSLKRIVAFFYLIFQAYFILYMGYIEYYSIPLSMSVMYIYYAIQCLKGKTSVVYPALVLIILILFHLLGVILFPSLVYLLLLKWKQDSIPARFFSYHYPMTLLSAFLVGLLITLTLRPGPLNKLLIAPSQLFSYYNYAPYFIFHISEILNLLILGAGSSIFLIVWFRRILFTQIKRDSLLNFLVINVFCSLLLIIFFNPSGNLAADWDIMTIPLLMLNILGIILLLQYSSIKLNLATYGINISQIFIFFIVWFLVNTIDDAAAQRINTIQNHSDPSGNPHRPKYTDGFSFKYYYLIEHDIPKCREIGEICLRSVNDESLREYADFFSEIHDYEISIRFVRKYIVYLENKINKGSNEWSDYYNLALYGYLITRQFDEAIISLRKAIELNPQNYELHFILGQAYDFNNNVDSALVEYACYDSLYDVNKALIFATRKRTLIKMYDLFVRTKRFDDGISFFKQRENMWYYYTFFLGALYCQKGDYEMASECFDRIFNIRKIDDREMIFDIAILFYNGKQYAKSWEFAQKTPLSDNKVWIALIDSLKNTQWYKDAKGKR